MTLSEYYSGALSFLGWLGATALLVYLTVTAHYRIKVRRIYKKHEHLSRYGAEEMYTPDWVLAVILILEGILIVIPSLLWITNKI